MSMVIYLGWRYGHSYVKPFGGSWSSPRLKNSCLSYYSAQIWYSCSTIIEFEVIEIRVLDCNSSLCMRKILNINLIIINKKNNSKDFLWAMFYVEKFTFFNCFFIGLIYFIIQQIDNYLRQIVDFIFLSFFLDFFFCG